MHYCVLVWYARKSQCGSSVWRFGSKKSDANLVAQRNAYAPWWSKWVVALLIAPSPWFCYLLHFFIHFFIFICSFLVRYYYCCSGWYWSKNGHNSHTHTHRRMFNYKRMCSTAAMCIPMCKQKYVAIFFRRTIRTRKKNMGKNTYYQWYICAHAHGIFFFVFCAKQSCANISPRCAFHYFQSNKELSKCTYCTFSAMKSDSIAIDSVTSIYRLHHLHSFELFIFKDYTYVFFVCNSRDSHTTDGCRHDSNNCWRLGDSRLISLGNETNFSNSLSYLMPHTRCEKCCMPTAITPLNAIIHLLLLICDAHETVRMYSMCVRVWCASASLSCSCSSHKLEFGR